MPAPRDVARAAVYAAEDQVASALDRGGAVDFFGSTLAVPRQRRFADIASIQRYVDEVLALAVVRRRWPQAGPVRVRERAGARQAHYEVGRATLAIPIAGPPPRWAARELVVLHELGHHVAPPDDDHPAHGPHFTGAVVALVAGALGAEAALLLRAAYDGAGVAVAEGP